VLILAEKVREGDIVFFANEFMEVKEIRWHGFPRDKFNRSTKLSFTCGPHHTMFDRNDMVKMK
jgi:hypothetical protein